MPDEVISQTVAKSETKPAIRKNVIPITSISDLGNVVGDIQIQINQVINKLNAEVSPEFKALMESYVKKANEAEELKISLANIISSHEELKAEITKVRETNRNLVQELHSAKEILKNLEFEFNTYQESSKKNEELLREKMKRLTVQNHETESKLKELEEEKENILKEGDSKIYEYIQYQEQLRQELLDQSYKFSKREQELLLERESIIKQLKGFEFLIKEQNEKVELKSKEVEYKDALLNQLIRHTTNEKLINQEDESKTKDIKNQKKRNNWFLK